MYQVDYKIIQNKFNKNIKIHPERDKTKTFAISTTLNLEYKESRRLFKDFNKVPYSFNLHKQTTNLA
jgi:hypothetical protein